MPKPKPTGELTTLSDLVDAYGRDVRYWSGYVDAMEVPVYRGDKNSKAIDQAALKRITARFPRRRLVPEAH